MIGKTIAGCQFATLSLRRCTQYSRWTRMKWSVNVAWSAVLRNGGMWQPTQPFVGLTGQTDPRLG